MARRQVDANLQVRAHTHTHTITRKMTMIPTAIPPQLSLPLDLTIARMRWLATSLAAKKLLPWPYLSLLPFLDCL